MASTAERPVSIDRLYADLERELASTRRMLERVPAGRVDFRPHEKSMTLGHLATHLAEIPGVAVRVLETDDVDISGRTGGPRIVDGAEALLEIFDATSAALRAAIGGTDWDALGRTWTFRNGDHVFVHDTKELLLRVVVISHMIHHRAQLGVYLRLLDVPLPSIYGPSADEMP